MRKPNIPTLLLSLLAAGVAGPALAVNDVPPKPKEISSVIHATAPYGAGKVTRIGITVYDDALWTDARPWSMAKPFALTLHYHMSFSSTTLVQKTLDEIERIDGVDDPTLEQYRKQLAAVFPRVKSGDTITALFLPGKETQFFYNGAATGSIKGDTFGKQFFDIWLSGKTSEPEARKQLLAGAATQ